MTKVMPTFLFQAFTVSITTIQGTLKVPMSVTPVLQDIYFYLRLILLVAGRTALGKAISVFVIQVTFGSSLFYRSLYLGLTFVNLPLDVHCEKPVTLDNSDIKIEGPEGHYVAGTTIRYTCKEGYVMSPGNFIGEVCGDDGNFSIIIDTSIMKYEKITKIEFSFSGF